MPRRSREVDKIKEDIIKIQKDLKSCNETIKELTNILEELEIYSSSSENELPTIKAVNRVVPTTDPHQGRT